MCTYLNNFTEANLTHDRIKCDDGSYFISNIRGTLSMLAIQKWNIDFECYFTLHIYEWTFATFKKLCNIWRTKEMVNNDKSHRIQVKVKMKKSTWSIWFDAIFTAMHVRSKLDCVCICVYVARLLVDSTDSFSLSLSNFSNIYFVLAFINIRKQTNLYGISPSNLFVCVPSFSWQKNENKNANRDIP